MKTNSSYDSVVVPVGEYSFSLILKRKLYFFPQRKSPLDNVKYVFFYRVKPIQAITHYGIIEKYIENADNMLDITEKMISFRDPAKVASAYKFSALKELDRAVTKDKKTVSLEGKVRGNFDRIINLESTKGLFKT